MEIECYDGLKYRVEPPSLAKISPRIFNVGSAAYQNVARVKRT
jgi:hypothetical protein